MSESPSTAQRIWVVDDDRAVRFVLCTALREAGYQVVDFDSAAPALQALREGPPPALLFTDVRMPGDDGLVLLDKLKAALPQLPVVVMSAYTDVASTAGAFRGGAHEFLSKPFDLDDAVALAQRVLPAVEPTLAAPSPAVETASDQPPQLVGDTPAMRALPIGVPKVMVSTMASGNVSQYVGTSDIVMIPSVVDAEGLNAISMEIFSNAVNAIVGMVKNKKPRQDSGRPLLAATMFGVTTPCIKKAEEYLQSKGYEVLVFHATGTGGKTMEALVKGGFIKGVLDITTTEWCDELFGGVLNAVS